MGLGGKLYPVHGGRKVGGHRQSMGSAAQWEGNKDVSLDFIARNGLEPSGVNRELFLVGSAGCVVWKAGLGGSIDRYRAEMTGWVPGL